MSTNQKRTGFQFECDKTWFFHFHFSRKSISSIKNSKWKIDIELFSYSFVLSFFFVFSLFTLISFFLRYICQYWICYFYLWHFYRWIICQLKANVLLDRWLAHNSFVSLNEKLSRLSKQFCSRFSLFNFVLLSNKSKQFTEFNKMSISDWLFCMQRSWNEI